MPPLLLLFCPSKQGVDYAIMTTLAERLEQLRQARADEAANTSAATDKAAQANLDATDRQLRKLIRAELDITDDLGESRTVQEPLSHGTPEGRYAVIELEDVWFGLPVSANAADDNRLLALVHCPNGHVLHMEYPHSGDDSWDQALMRVEDTQQVYADTTNCQQCMTYRTTARDYQPKV